MLRTVVFLFLFSAVGLGQTSPASSAMACSESISGYPAWSAQQSFPFSASLGTRERLMHGYSQLRLGMTKKDVAALFPRADFVVPETNEPDSVTCLWVYVIHDTGDDSPKSRKTILLGFLQDDTLAFASPINLEELHPIKLQHPSCISDSPGLETWFATTPLATGKPFEATQARKESLVSSYTKLALGLSVNEAERILGKPDFVMSIPAGSRNPYKMKLPCVQELAYVISQKSDNVIDPANVGIFVSFDYQGELFLASPQNLPGLKQIGSENAFPTKGVQ